MTYYITIFAQSDNFIPAHEIQSWLELGFIDPCDSEDQWTELYLCETEEEGSEIAQIHKHIVHPGSIGEETLKWFTEKLTEMLPASARLWVGEQLRKTTVIYSVQLINFGVNDGELEVIRWRIVNRFCFGILHFSGGILHQENCGYLNAKGQYITLESGIGEAGIVEVAAYQNGRWSNYPLDLSDTEQKSFFLCRNENF